MIAERISHDRIVSKLGADRMGEGYQAQDTNSIATLRVRFCRPGTLSARFDLTGLLKVVGAWGLEPQTSAVSRPWLGHLGQRAIFAHALNINQCGLRSHSTLYGLNKA